MDISQISADLREHHYCHRRNFRELIEIEPGEENSFRAYWNNLVRDEAFRAYTHRERRILRYRLSPSRQLHINRDAAFKSPVTYAIEYRQGVNHLSYCEESFIDHSLTRKLLAVDLALIEPHLVERAYTIDIHLFRVRADRQSSSPTTSGIHQDGLDWVFMHFIGQYNTVPVVSELFTSESEHSRVLNFPMEQFLETIVVNDRELYHRAGDVRPQEDSAPAWRDLLVVSLRSVPADEEGLPV
ncbi:2OG-Fe dioxygenase family protein [Pseudomonas palleroniana]